MKLFRLLIFTATFCLTASTLQAQTTKKIAVSHKEPTVDQLSFGDGKEDMEVTVKFLFDEDSNTLTVTLTSPKSLFVFWADNRYKDVFSCNRWLRSDNFPYVVSSNTADSFRAGKKFRKSLKCPRRKHLFLRWIEVEGLKPAEKKLELLNDSIMQTFVIQDNTASGVTVRLRDIMIMEEVKCKGQGCQYEIVHGKDFNIKYRIALLRNPCLGLEDDLSAAESSLDAVRKCHVWFKGKYLSGKVNDETSFNDFNEIKQAFTEQFTKVKTSSPCPQIQQVREQYNLVVDSIQLINVTLDTVPFSAAESKGHALNAQNILSNARMLDRAVARWLASNDDIERADLKEQCRSIVEDTFVMIGSRRGFTAEEQHAVEIFRKAEQYYRKVCK